MPKYHATTAPMLVLALIVFACGESSPIAPTAVGEPAPGLLDAGRSVELAEHAAVVSFADAALDVPAGASTGATTDEDVTLKATAPEPASPRGGNETPEISVTLVTLNATATELPDVVVPFEYRFQLFDASMALVHEGTVLEQGIDTTSYHVPLELPYGADFKWRVRAELDGRTGPWSSPPYATFSTPLGIIAPPTPSSPRNGAMDVWPVVLEVRNGDTSGQVGQVVMTFEVASDQKFSSSMVKTYEQPAGSERTSVRISAGDLDAETTYYWRVTARDDLGTSSESSVQWSFTVSAVTIAPPLPVQPTNGATGVRAPTTLLVKNGTTRGPVGALNMTFEIATDAAFTIEGILETITQPAGQHVGEITVDRATHTSVRLSVELDPITPYYWRVTAGDDKGNSSGYSDRWSFTTADVTASGADQLHPSDVTWLHPLVGDRSIVAGWPATSTITGITIRDDRAGGGICVDHTKANSWPGAPADSIGHPNLAGNAWVFAKVDGRWYGGTYEWLGPGQICKLSVPPGGCGPGCGHDRPSRELGKHVKTPPLDRSWVPRPGDQIGFMVSTMARFGPEGPLRERSNIVLVTWP